MIKIENINTCNWEAAIRSMRNPLNSWDKSDSGYGCEEGKVCRFCPHNFSPNWCGNNNDNYILGPNDHKLDEWHEFCAMIEKLPYSELITEVRE